MKYNNATDRYESEFLEPILDTNFKYGVPYKINREIYENAFKQFNKNSSIKHAIKHADVVVFHAHYDEDYGSYTFFAFPKIVQKIMIAHSFMIMMINIKNHLKILYMPYLNL